MQLAVAGCAVAPPADRFEAAGKRLTGYLDALERRGFAGQVAIVHQGEILIREGRGRMGTDDSRPVPADAVMPLASVTKPLAASLVMALAAEGRLALDDPIGKHLPGLGSPWSEITVESLTTHTSGLPAEIASRRWEGPPRFEPVDLETFLKRIRRFPPDPDAGFRYSNLGYGLLAAVIEAACGQSWEDCLVDRLLQPADIEGIGLLYPGWGDADIVRSRQSDHGRTHHLEQPRLNDGMGWHLRGSGDLLARPAGVIAWWRAVRDGRWLPDPWLERWLTPQVREPDGSRYGHGLHFRASRLGRAIGHTGEDLGYSVSLYWYPESDLMVYINAADPRFAADRLRDRIERILAAP